MERYWHVVGASVQGPAHERAGLPNQDACQYGVLEGKNVAIVIVSDGMSSCQYAQDGATESARAIYQYLSNKLASITLEIPLDWYVIISEAARDGLRAIKRHAQENERHPDEYGCTFTCVIAWETGFVTAQIGDGLVVARSKTGDLFVATKPQTGDEPNQTFALEPANVNKERLAVTLSYQEIDAFAVMTDGVWRMTGSYDPIAILHPNPQFYDAIFGISSEANPKEQLSRLLADPKMAERSGDDKTLIVGTRSKNVTGSNVGIDPIEEQSVLTAPTPVAHGQQWTSSLESTAPQTSNSVIKSAPSVQPKTAGQQIARNRGSLSQVGHSLTLSGGIKRWRTKRSPRRSGQQSPVSLDRRTAYLRAGFAFGALALLVGVALLLRGMRIRAPGDDQWYAMATAVPLVSQESSIAQATRRTTQSAEEGASAPTATWPATQTQAPISRSRTILPVLVITSTDAVAVSPSITSQVTIVYQPVLGEIQPDVTLSLRDAPNMVIGERLAQYEGETRVVILEQARDSLCQVESGLSGPWVRVRVVADGREGWMCGAYLTIISGTLDLVPVVNP